MSSAVEKVQKRPGGRTGEVTKRLFATTISMLRADGYAALNLKEVAEAAGVSRSTIYRRWPTKAELTIEAISASMREHIIMADTGSLAGDLSATLLLIAASIQSRLGIASLIALLENTDAPVQDLRERLWAIRRADLMPIFERASARGEISPDYDGEAAFAMASGALYFRMIIMGGKITPEWIDRIVRQSIAAQYEQ